MTLTTFVQRWWDVGFAAVVALSGAVTTHHAYARLLEEANRSYSALDQFLIDGVTQYSILGKQGCVGTLTTTIDLVAGSLIKVEGSFNTAFGARSVTQKVDLLVMSNPLGQVFNISGSIKSDQADARISAKDVNPITITASLETPTINQQRSFIFPGPIEIKRVDGSWRITSRALANVQRGVSSHMLDLVRADTGLSIARGTESCQEARSSLQLLPVFQRLQAFLPSWAIESLTANDLKVGVHTP